MVKPSVQPEGKKGTLECPKDLGKNVFCKMLLSL